MSQGKALWGFSSERPGDLCFKKGDLITILSTNANAQGWYKGQLSSGETGILPPDYVELSPVGNIKSVINRSSAGKVSDTNSNLKRGSVRCAAFFAGDISGSGAATALKDKPNGTYLFRMSSAQGFLAVSYVNKGSVQHGKVEVSEKGYRFDTDTTVYDTLDALISDYRVLLKTPLVLNEDSGRKGSGRRRRTGTRGHLQAVDPNSPAARNQYDHVGTPAPELQHSPGPHHRLPRRKSRSSGSMSSAAGLMYTELPPEGGGMPLPARGSNPQSSLLRQYQKAPVTTSAVPGKAPVQYGQLPADVPAKPRKIGLPFKKK